MSKEKKDKGGEGKGSWWCYMMLGPLLLWMAPQQHLHLTHSSLIFASYIQHLPSVCPDGWPLFVQPFIVTSGTPLREDTFVHLHHSVSGETRLSRVFQKEKNNESTIQALLCIALLHSDHLRPDAFLSLRGAVHVTVPVQSLRCVWLCNPMHCSKLGSSVLHYLPEFAQTYVHWVGDAI